MWYSPGNCSFIHLKNYSFIYTWLFENMKARILKSNITWSEMGQQTTQAKEVYFVYFNSYPFFKHRPIALVMFSAAAWISRMPQTSHIAFYSISIRRNWMKNNWISQKNLTSYTVLRSYCLASSHQLWRWIEFSLIAFTTFVEQLFSVICISVFILVLFKLPILETRVFLAVSP